MVQILLSPQIENIYIGRCKYILNKDVIRANKSVIKQNVCDVAQRSRAPVG